MNNVQDAFKYNRARKNIIIFGAVILIAITALSCVSSFLIYRLGFADLPYIFQQMLRKPTKKPPCAPGYFWRTHGAGWDLRRDLYVTSHDGERKRRQPYIAHMSREALRELKRQHRGAALERAILDWINSHDK